MESGPAADTRVVALMEQAGWVELAAVPIDRLAPLPAGVGTEHAASLPVGRPDRAVHAAARR